MEITPALVMAARIEYAKRKLGRGIPCLVGLLQPMRYKGAWGGRASGKSNTFAEMVVLAMLLNPNASVVCIREIQKSLELSAKKLIEAKIEEFGLGFLFDCQKYVIKRIGGKGLCIFQGLQDHTADSIKSLEGFDIAWVEEAQNLSARSIKLLRPTLRKKGSELWFSWNPGKRGDPIEQLLRSRSGERDNAIVLRSNYQDNPFIPEEMLKEASDDKRDDPQGYPHTWLGAYEDVGSKVVIPALWVDAAIGLVEDLGLQVTGKKYSALDVAGGEEGGDENAQAFREGIELQNLDKWNGLDTSLTTQRSAKAAYEYGASLLFYDSVGVGEGVTGEWASMGRRGERPNKLMMVPWNGGGSVLRPDEKVDPSNPKSPINKNQYHNMKAQGWFSLRKRFYNAFLAREGRPYDPDMLISIRRDLPYLVQLQDELSQPEQKPSGTGKVMVDKQPDNAKSPNVADSVMQAYFPIEAGYNLASAL